MKVDGKAILESARKHVKVDIDLDGFVLEQVDALVIPMTDALLAKFNKLIPGPIDDAVVASVKPQLYAEMKEELKKILIKAEVKIDEVIHGVDK